MAKKTNKKPPLFQNLLERLRAGEWLKHPRLPRFLAFAAVGTLVIFGANRVLGYLETHVHSLSRYDKTVLAIEWQDLPQLLRRPDNRHILDSIKNKIDLKSTDHILDAGLATRVGRSLSDPSIGWIKAVDRVTVRPDGVVAVKCQFREPSAYVQHGDDCYLVDGDGVLLPGIYRAEDCATSKLLLITGVQRKPPLVGRVWSGEDVKAGLKLASLISARRFRNQVDRIIVANFDGRIDRKRPQIELATDHAGSRIWWGQAPSREDGTETTCSQKLALLDRLYQSAPYRIDLNRAYVDIRTNPNSVSIARNSKSPVRQ